MRTRQPAVHALSAISLRRTPSAGNLNTARRGPQGKGTKNSFFHSIPRLVVIFSPFTCIRDGGGTVFYKLATSQHTTNSGNIFSLYLYSGRRWDCFLQTRLLTAYHDSGNISPFICIWDGGGTVFYKPVSSQHTTNSGNISPFICIWDGGGTVFVNIFQTTLKACFCALTAHGCTLTAVPRRSPLCAHRLIIRLRHDRRVTTRSRPAVSYRAADLISRARTGDIRRQYGTLSLQTRISRATRIPCHDDIPGFHTNRGDTPLRCAPRHPMRVLPLSPQSLPS